MSREPTYRRHLKKKRTTRRARQKATRGFFSLWMMMIKKKKCMFLILSLRFIRSGDRVLMRATVGE